MAFFIHYFKDATYVASEQYSGSLIMSACEGAGESLARHQANFARVVGAENDGERRSVRADGRGGYTVEVTRLDLRKTG